MNLKALKKGDKVFVVGLYNHTQNFIGIVSNIGRKYVKVFPEGGSIYNCFEFSLDTGTRNGDHSHDYMLFASKEEYDNECYRKALIAELVRYLSERHDDIFTLDTLTSVAKMLKIDFDRVQKNGIGK